MNKALDRTVREIRIKGLKKCRPQDKARFWMEKDLMEGSVVDAGVMILPTHGCSWARASGCTMCGYVYEAGSQSGEALIKTFSRALDEMDKTPYLKVFTSGSFFDPREIPLEVRDALVRLAYEKGVEQFQVESRPEYIKEGSFEHPEVDLKWEVGIGLETSNDLLRESAINKGFTFKDFARAVDICRSNRAMVKTYLLLKPPFILEREAIDDIVKSALRAVDAGSDKISINPMNIQRFTLVERLWKRGGYRPPWLWSLLECLRQLSGLDATILSHPTGGASRRGVHNCGECDRDILDAVKSFSLSQEPDVLEGHDCSCKRYWSDYLLLE